MNLALHPSTSQAVKQYAARPTHALLLSGPRGVGLKTLAEYMAASIGTIMRIVEPVSITKGGPRSISPSVIRELYETTRSSLTGKNVVIIDDAQSMHHSAQNALLKLLEEPNPSIYFILTSHQPDSLLPTIRSRSQQIVVAPIDAGATARLLKQLDVTDSIKQSQLRYLADGLPAEITRVASNPNELAKRSQYIAQAKIFISGGNYDRIKVASDFRENRSGTLDFIDTSLLVLQRSFEQRPSADIAHRIDVLLSVRERIQANGNIRLQLLRAMV